MNAVEARALVRKFGDFTAVNGVDFDVQPGEIFGFLGPNGAGKSTTINMLCTVLRPTSGTARINGHDGVWGCHTQFNCTEVCPMGIAPTRAIQKLKRREVRHALTHVFR